MGKTDVAQGPVDVTVMQQQVQRDIDRLNKERQVTVEMMNTPMDAPILAMRRSEWRALSPEAQAKLMQITGAIHPDELRRRAQAAEDLRKTPLVHNAKLTGCPQAQPEGSPR